MKVSPALCGNAWAFKPSPLQPSVREKIKDHIGRRAAREQEASVSSLEERHTECDASWQNALGADSPPEKGDLVSCPRCGAWVVALGDGIVIDEDSNTEHECEDEA